MNNLTVIIPFLNEGIEIENTLFSIRFTVGHTVEILLINDCSTDEFDYETRTIQFNVRYHKNKERIGVAASRDLGVSMITTPYFLFLDGHMRFYDSNWATRIVEELKTNNKTLLCCQTKTLHKENDQIDVSEVKTFGAYINLIDEEKLLSANWNYFESNNNISTEDIPCILGAAYACTKEYWQYLKGLSGLMYYGGDETYISLKIWLNGGRCKLLKDVIVGHIYRRTFPYKIENIHVQYNNLLIAELLLPDHLKKMVFSQINQRVGDTFFDINRLIKEKEYEISELKRYYQSILTIDFNSIYQWNANIQLKHDNVVLQRIADYLIHNNNQTNNPGLLYGKMGIVIFFSHYSRYTGLKSYDEFAENLLDEIYSILGKNSPIDFQSGLCGIGWGIEYLVQNGLMAGNTDEILEDIDKKVTMNTDVENISDISLEKGLCGIVHYVYARVLSAHINKRCIPIHRDFLNRLFFKTSAIILENQEYKHVDILFRFLSFINNGVVSEEFIKLDHIITLPAHYYGQFEKQPLGLQFGHAGVGIKKMRII